MKFEYINEGQRSVTTTPESKGGVQSPSFDLLVLHILILSWLEPNQGQTNCLWTWHCWRAWIKCPCNSSFVKSTVSLVHLNTLYIDNLSYGRRVWHGKVWHGNCCDGCDETRGYYEIYHSSCYGRYVGRIYLCFTIFISSQRYHRHLRSSCGSSYCWPAIQLGIHFIPVSGNTIVPRCHQLAFCSGDLSTWAPAWAWVSPAWPLDTRSGLWVTPGWEARLSSPDFSWEWF